MNFRHHAGERGLVEMLIEHLPLRAALDQVLKLLLAVYLDEEFGKLPQLLYRHQLTVHIGTRASVDADHAPHDQLAIVFDGLRFEPREGRIGKGGDALRDLGSPPPPPQAMRSKASTTIDFPAPVSPVSAVRPGPKSSSASSTMTRSRSCRWVSMRSDIRRCRSRRGPSEVWSGAGGSSHSPADAAG